MPINKLKKTAFAQTKKHISLPKRDKTLSEYDPKILKKYRKKLAETDVVQTEPEIVSIKVDKEAELKNYYDEQIYEEIVEEEEKFEFETIQDYMEVNKNLEDWEKYEHIKPGQNCDVDFKFFRPEENRPIVAISQGCSHTKYYRVGSKWQNSKRPTSGKFLIF